MKALTVQQPWAWAIIHGGKDVENRTQAWTYRGPLLIHAGRRWSTRGGGLIPAVVDSGGVVPGLLDDEQLAAYEAEFGADTNPPGTAGAVIGVVDLVDIHNSITCVDTTGAMCSPWAESHYAEHGGRTRRDIVHLELANPRPLPEPIPCRGALGRWTPPPDVLAQVQEQLR